MPANTNEVEYMKLKILGKVCAPIMVILLLVTGGGFYFAYKASKGSIESLLDAELAAVSRLLARNIETFSTMAQRDMRTLSQMTRIHDFLTQPEKAAYSTRMREALATFAKDYPYFESILLADRTGRIVGSSDNNAALNINIADRDYFIQALAGKATFSEPVISRYTNSSVFPMSCPVTVDNKVIAVLTATVPLDEFSASMVGGIRIAQTGYPIIISANGIVAAHHETAQLGKTQVTNFD